MILKELPVPGFFNHDEVGTIWKVPYQDRAGDAVEWRKKHKIFPAHKDQRKIALLLVDVQNTFCIPGFELFVGGRSGHDAVDDNRRLTQFIYRNLNLITTICPTLDTHQATQIFHSVFLVNKDGDHPEPYTIVTHQDIVSGSWRFNDKLGEAINISAKYGQEFLEYYTRTLHEGGKYDLTIWPYHAMLGGIGHALVPAVEEAIFFHCLTRYSQPDIQIKGFSHLTENYSVLNPEVSQDEAGQDIAPQNREFLQRLFSYDVIIIAGQAKSHCVAWTIEDLLNEMQKTDKQLITRVYLLEDCSSPVVIPGVIDYTEHADKAFARFSEMGAHIVQSQTPIFEWPQFKNS